MKSSGARAVYFGGEYPQAGALKKQLVGAGFEGPLGGGDAIKDEAIIPLAGQKPSDGFYATSAGVPVSTLDSAKGFISAYKAAGYNEPFGVFGAYTINTVKGGVWQDGVKVFRK